MGKAFRLPLAGGLFLGLFLGLPAATARAGNTSDCYYVGLANQPAENATGVPLNPMLFFADVNYADDGSGTRTYPGVSLRGEDGDVVTATAEYLSSRGMWCGVIYRPDRALHPLTRYTAQVEGTFPDVSFTTGEASDLVVPSFTLGEDDPGAGLDAEIQGADDLVVLIYHLPADLGWATYVVMPEAGWLRSSTAGEDGSTLTVRGWDRAGNSAEAQVIVLAPSTADGCGCDATGAGASVLGAAFLLVVGIALRRRGEALR